MTAEVAALAPVICDIYDAAIDPALWINALRSACEFIGAGQANLFWQDTSAETVMVLHQYNDDPRYTQLYQEVYAPLNPVFPAAIFRDAGTVMAATDLVPWPEMKETRFFKEWIEPQGLGDSMGVLLEKDAHRAAFLTFQGPPDFVDEASRERAALLVPHFQRAVAIGRLFAKREATTAAFAQTLNYVDESVVLLSNDGQIVFANPAGRRMLEEGAVLKNVLGALGATAPDADRELKESIQAITSGDVSIEGTGGASVTLSGNSNIRWIASILPLVDGSRRRAGDMHEASVAVFIRRSEMERPAPIETLARRYGLTASEVRVAEALLRVSGIDGLSDALGVSRSTVKTHLNHILRKCGARNQGDLIKLIVGLGE